MLLLCGYLGFGSAGLLNLLVHRFYFIAVTLTPISIINFFLSFNRNAFKHELTLLEKVRHPNVLQFVGAVTQNKPMMIVSEYHPKVSKSIHSLLPPLKKKKKGVLAIYMFEFV